MTTLVNNNESNNVANNVNENNGYNSEVTNEVVVLNGDTFYKKNIVVGQKYRYSSHYFVIDKFETRGTHLYYIGTLDKKPFENDLHALKVACECTERRAMNRSANDTENSTAKVVADEIVCRKKAEKEYLALSTAVELICKRYSATPNLTIANLQVRLQKDIASRADSMLVIAKQRLAEQQAKSKEVKEYANSIASKKAQIDEIRKALAIEKAKPRENRDIERILELSDKLEALLA